MSKGRIISLVFLILIFAVTTTQAFDVQTSLIQEYTMEPGESEQFEFTVNNKHEHPIEVEVSLEEEGIPNDHLLSEGIEISPTNFELMPDEDRDVRVYIDIPEEVPNVSNWIKVAVSEEPIARGEIEEDLEEITAGITHLFQYNIRIINTPPEAPLPEGELVGLNVEPDPFSFEVEFENTGQVYTRPEGVLEIRDETGETVHDMEISDFGSYPGKVNSRTVEYDGPELDSGQYLILVQLDFGGEYVTSAQVTLNLTE